MADTPVKDRKLGLPRTRVGGRFVTAYTPDLALRICERIAEGETLSAICEADDMPHRTTFRRWVLANPELRNLLETAREMSAYSLEEEAIDMARALRRKPIDSVHVRAHEVLLNQLRWSAAKRNKQEFSEKANVKVTVPIQINTVLDMGAQTTGRGTAEHPNVYEIKAGVEQEEDISEKPFVELDAKPPTRSSEGQSSYPARRRADEAEQRDIRTNSGKRKRI